MPPTRVVTLAVAMLLALAARPASAQIAASTCAPARTALVLSGGGAKGLAHIGVLRVLDSLGIRPDLIVGTSIGAIIGGLYASGYTAAQVDSVTRSLDFSRIFAVTPPKAPAALGTRRALVSWEEQPGRGFRIQLPVVNEAQANAVTSAAMLRGNLIARGDFDSLPIPFRAVAADLSDASPVVFRGGDLARAVRTSFAIPAVFPPVVYDRRALVDGGIAANVPVAIARQEGAVRVIVSDVSDRTRREASELDSPIAVAGQLIDLLTQQPADSLGPDDVYLRPAIEGIGLLSFEPARFDSIIQLGQRAADTTLARAACLAPLGAPGPSREVPTQVGSVGIATGMGTDLLLLRRYLGLVPGAPLDEALLRRRLLELADEDRYRAVWLSPAGTGDEVSFDLLPRHTARRSAGFGLVYDNDMGGRVWFGGLDREALLPGLSAGAIVGLGEYRREVAALLQGGVRVGPRVVPFGGGMLSEEDVRRFEADFAGGELPTVGVREALVQGGFEARLPGGWGWAAGVESRFWSQPDGPDLGAVGLMARVDRVMRNGDRHLLAEAAVTSRYQRFHVDGSVGGRIGRLEYRPHARIGYGNDLPLQVQFPLGGYDGFPGLHITELRGDREFLFGVLAQLPLVGGLALRADAMTGRSAQGGSLLASDGWLGGVRAGLGLDTPIGPVRAEYGLNTEGRGLFFVRLGQWF